MDLRGDLIKYLTKRPYWTLRTETTTCFQKMAGRKVLIVYAHQEPKSLNGSLKSVAVEELGKQGCSVTVSDLYAMQFEPRATRNDIVGCLLNSEQFNYGVEAREAYKRGNLSDDLIEEQKKVQEADLLIFQFPLYWFSMPAIMKGWMDRVLVEGFAHKFPDCYDSGLLKDKLALFSFTTGGSREMYAQGGISGDIRYLLWPMQHGIMHYCGVKVLAPHICFAPEYVSEEKRKEMLLAWAQRLKTLWKEEPVNCSPEWYFK
ncbi:ribosyldihydronicotinamide dehydrogenase [quinone] isoform X1 [Struthio camelus]